MEAILKLHAARQIIKKTKIKKAGYNNYSGYHYFTPDQVAELTSNPNFGLFNKFDLIRTELGLIGRLTVTDLDSGKSVIFEMATDIPVIKATNIAQQLGGASTYTERYLLMTAYEIKDNSLDFDANKQTAAPLKPVDKPELTEDMKEAWANVLKFLSEGGDIEKVKAKYSLSESTEKYLKGK